MHCLCSYPCLASLSTSQTAELGVDRERQDAAIFICSSSFAWVGLQVKNSLMNTAYDNILLARGLTIIDFSFKNSLPYSLLEQRAYIVRTTTSFRIQIDKLQIF